MERNKKDNYIEPISVDIIDLQKMLGLSKNVCMQIGKDSNAVINLGIRRTLYNVQKIKEYMDSKTGIDNN